MDRKFVEGRIVEGTLRFLSLQRQGILSLRLSKPGNVAAYGREVAGWWGDGEFSASPKCQEAGLTWAGYPGSAWWARCCAVGTRRAPSWHSWAD